MELIDKIARGEQLELEDLDGLEHPRGCFDRGVYIMWIEVSSFDWIIVDWWLIRLVCPGSMVRWNVEKHLDQSVRSQTMQSILP